MRAHTLWLTQCHGGSGAGGGDGAGGGGGGGDEGGADGGAGFMHIFAFNPLACHGWSPL